MYCRKITLEVLVGQGESQLMFDVFGTSVTFSENPVIDASGEPCMRIYTLEVWERSAPSCHGVIYEYWRVSSELLLLNISRFETVWCGVLLVHCPLENLIYLAFFFSYASLEHDEAFALSQYSMAPEHCSLLTIDSSPQLLSFGSMSWDEHNKQSEDDSEDDSYEETDGGLISLLCRDHFIR